MKSSRASFELGVTRLFGKGDIGLSGLRRGWAAPEDAHSWNDGVEAVMELNVETSEQPFALEFEGRPFINTLCPTQAVSLYCNGFLTGFWGLNEPKSHTLSVIIEPEQAFMRDDRVFMKLAWVLPNSTVPAGIKLNNDGRRLGFCFSSLTVRAADDDVRE